MSSVQQHSWILWVWGHSRQRTREMSPVEFLVFSFITSEWGRGWGPEGSLTENKHLKVNTPERGVGLKYKVRNVVSPELLLHLFTLHIVSWLSSCYWTICNICVHLCLSSSWGWSVRGGWSQLDTSFTSFWLFDGDDTGYRVKHKQPIFSPRQEASEADYFSVYASSLLFHCFQSFLIIAEIHFTAELNQSINNTLMFPLCKSPLSFTQQKHICGSIFTSMSTMKKEVRWRWNLWSGGFTHSWHSSCSCTWDTT